MPNTEVAGGDSITVAKLNESTVGTSAPTAPVEGDMWVDTSTSGNPVIKIYNGSSWDGWPNFIRKSADESVTSSTVLQDDDEVQFAVGANEVWLIHLVILINAPATPDIKFQWSLPAGASMEGNAAVPDSAYFDESSSIIVYSPGSGDFAVVMTAVIIIGATAGDVILQWAQNTSNASASKVLKDTTAILRKVA